MCASSTRSVNKDRLTEQSEKNAAGLHDGHRERLRQRFIKGGISAFQEYEILEFLFSVLIPRKDVKPLAKQMIARFQSVSGFLDADISELVNAGLSLRVAVTVNFFRALITLYRGEKMLSRPLLSNSLEVITFLQTKLGGLKKETLHVLFLDSGRHLLGSAEWAGTVDRAYISPREIAEKALLLRATGVILAHNHPSGNCKPSSADMQFTKSVFNALELFDIKLLDHLIISRQDHVSLMY